MEAGFQAPGGEQLLRITVVDESDAYAVETALPRNEGPRVRRQPGWHRLEVEFSAATMLVTVDDRLLWFSRRQGPGGPLAEVRLFCVAVPGKDKPRGAVLFDEFSLARTVEPRKRPEDHQPGVDEVWLASGDQVFGRLGRVDRHQVELDTPFGRRNFSWAEMRGLFPRRLPGPLQETQGEHLRLVLYPAAGNEPDELEGVLTVLDSRRLVLRHSALGEVEIPRSRLQRMRKE